MNKYIIGILCLIGIIVCDTTFGIYDDANGIIPLICPKEKLKLGDVCAVKHKEMKNGNEIYYFHIKKTCGKNKICSNKEGNIYQCASTKPFEYLKIDQSCTIDEECLSGKCDGKCKEKTDSCTDSKECGEGKYCRKKSGDPTGKCEEYVEEDKECFNEGSEAKKKCAPGLTCIFDSSTVEKGKCGKYGTLATGKYCGPDSSDCVKKCESGLSDGTYCLELTSASECDGSGKCNYKLKGVGGSNDEVSTENAPCNEKGPDKIKVCPYTTEKAKYWKDKVLPRFKKLDFKGLKKEKYSINDYANDRKLSEYIQVYSNWDELIGVKFIDKNGKVLSDKNCEYKFWWSSNSSGFTKLCLTLLSSLVVLLF